MKEKLKNLKFGIIILISAVIVSIPLFWKNLDVYVDDGVQHIVRAYSTYQSIKSGENTAVLSNLANGYGYSWNLFYGPFSTYLILFTKFLTVSFVKAYKIALFIGLLLSGITMYSLVKRITGSKEIGVLSGVLYMTMPYHLNDMYIRNSLGEFLSFIFIPLVFLGMYKLFNKEKGDWILVIGAVGLIITHNLMAVIVAIVAFGYLCANLIDLKDKDIRTKLIFDLIFILCISAFYWVPFMETSFSTNYAVYQKDMMATVETVKEKALDLKRLFVTPNDSEYVYETGPHILVMLCFSVAALRKLDKKYKKEYIFFLVVGIFASFIATKYFPWGLFGERLTLIQFPWRMLTISNFCFAIVCAINMSLVINRFKLKDVIVVSIISIIYIVSLKGFVPTTEYVKRVNEWSIGTVSGKKNEVIVGMGRGEYLPKTLHEDTFYLASREDTVLILEGDGIIENVEKNGSKLTCRLESTEDCTVFEFPYVYYPGYKITIDGSELRTFESENGLLSIAINKISMSDVVVEYEGTSIIKYSKVFSVISTVLFIAYICVAKKEENQEIDKSIEK